MSEKLKDIFFCMRGLLWLIIFYAVFLLVEVYCNSYNIFALLLILFLCLIICLWLSYNQISEDIKFVRNKKIQARFINEDDHESKDQELLPHEKITQEYGEASREFFWDTLYYRRHVNIKSYCCDNVKIKRSVYFDIHSIQIWYEDEIISFDYNTPVSISEILAFRIVKNSYVTPGEEKVSYTTKQSGKVTPTFFGKSKYKGTSRTVKTISQIPSSIDIRYSLYIILKQLGSQTLEFELGGNEGLLREIECEFLRLGFKCI